MEINTNKKYKLAIAILCKEFVHNIQDLQRLGALDKDSVEQINAVFEVNVRKRGILPPTTDSEES